MHFIHRIKHEIYSKIPIQGVELNKVVQIKPFFEINAMHSPIYINLTGSVSKRTLALICAARYSRYHDRKLH